MLRRIKLSYLIILDSSVGRANKNMNNKFLYSIGKYYAVYYPTHHRAHVDGCVYEHILVAEQKIGRLLKDSEVVHHIDFNGLNNNPDNLLVLQNTSEHTKLHNYIKNNIPYIIKYNEDKSAYINYIEEDNSCFIITSNTPKNRCIDCGTIIDNKAIRCKQCFLIKKRNIIKLNNNLYSFNFPSRESLKYQIRMLPFTSVAKLYNVTDNAVRKWCDKYGLPRKSGDIKKYSEEEWILL